MSSNYFGGFNLEMEFKRAVDLYYVSLSDLEKKILFEDLDYQKSFGGSLKGNEFLCLLFLKLKNDLGFTELDNVLFGYNS